MSINKGIPIQEGEIAMPQFDDLTRSNTTSADSANLHPSTRNANSHGAQWKIRNGCLIFAICLGLALSGCDGDSAPAATTAGTTITTTGAAVKGPLDCSAQGSVIARGAGGKTATGSTPSVGSFSADMTGLTFPVTVTVSGCMDTITGATQDFGLSTMVMDATQTVINATPVSTLAVATAKAARVGGGAITPADLNAAVATVLRVFGLSASFPNPVTGVFNTVADITNLVVASEAVSEVIKRSATATPGGASTANIIASFAADLADGALDGVAPAGVPIPVPVATAGGIKGNLMAKVFDEVAAGNIAVHQVDPLTGVVLNTLPSNSLLSAIAAQASATTGTAVTAASIHPATTATSINARPPARPVIALTGANPLIIAQGFTFTDPGSMVTDNVDTGLTATVTGAVNTATVGTYTLTYNVSDTAGNAATTATRTVNVTDQTAPTVTAPAAITVAAVDGTGTVATNTAIAAFLNGATATDNVDTTSTVTHNGPTKFPLGATTVTFSSTDAAGNTGTATAVVTVTDQTAPTVTAPAAITVAAVDGTGTLATNATITVFLAGGSATDNVDTALTVTNNAPTLFPLGTTTVTFSSTDAAGNTGTATSTVTVADQTAPMITLLGANTLTVAQGSTFTDPGSTVRDNVDTGLTATATGTVNTATVGTYTLTYHVSDAAGNAATAVTRTVNVVVFPTVSIAPASVLEGSGGGTTNLNFTVTLSTASTTNVSVNYATSDGTALSTSDYTATTATLTISAGQTTGTITVLVNADTTFEPNETLTLTLSNPTNATLGTAVAIGTILNDDVGGMNDTGVTKWGDATRYPLAAKQTLFPGQDADHGRDAQAKAGTLVKMGGSSNANQGFDFTKLDAAGQPLPNQAAIYTTTPWDCVQDNVTGLMWEVKTTTPNSLRNKNNVYTWYNSTGVNDGGNAGTPAATPACSTGGSCDTEKYVAAINAAGLCGFHDWRLPKKEALDSIMDYGVVASNTPKIDAAYFPNTVFGPYRSASTYAGNTANAWDVYFGQLYDLTDRKAWNGVYIRLVRGGL